MVRSPVVQFIISHPSVLLQTDFWREIFMIPERVAAQSVEDIEGKRTFIIKTLSTPYVGKLFVFEGMFYAIADSQRIDDRSEELRTYNAVGEPTGIVYNPKETLPLCTPQDVIILSAGEIENYPQGPDIETSLGIFIANYVFLVYPFGSIIAYMNEEISTSKIEKKIAVPLLDGRISTSDVKDRYVNAMFLFGQSTDIFSPGISEKTVTVPPHITALRSKLVEENREALEGGDVTVMAAIEQQLIKAFKDYLQGDSSLHFLIKSKHFNVALKKLFLVQGTTEVFGSPGKFTFVANPMGSGWKVEDLHTIYNEVRQGSYARAVETQQGGVIAKLILRILQDTLIDTPDCGTKRGEKINATADQIKDFEWNYVIEPDGSNTLITQESMPLFVGRDIVVRTPGYCQAPVGFCAKCFGRVFEILGQKAFAPIANDFARNQTTNSLKAMHGKSHSTVDVSDLNKYII